METLYIILITLAIILVIFMFFALIVGCYSIILKRESIYYREPV